MTETDPISRLKVQVWVCAPAGPVKGDFLVLLLLTRPERGSFWQPVTGGVESGEALHAAALREMREETGLSPMRSELMKVGESFTFMTLDGALAREQAYAGFVGPEQIPSVQLDSREHVKYEWVHPREALGRLKFDSNRRILGELTERIRV